MNDRTNEKVALMSAGIEALRRGDAAAARASFERVVGAGGADAPAFVGLAYACRALGDGAGVLAAAERALALEPRNPRALLLKADHLAAGGDDRAASSFYLAAIRAVAQIEQMPADLRDAIARAQAACNRYAATFEEFLRDRVGREALQRPSGARFAESIEILVGRKAPNVQRPRYYFFPGLAAVAFHDRAAFPFLDTVEAATDRIRAELLQVLADDAAFEPYIKSDPGRPRREQAGLLDNPAWSAFYLWKDGERIEKNAARCPDTMRALEQVPLCRVTNRSPSVLFSLLRPGAHIPPHTGMVNTRLICHLPLIVPGPCTFRVGNETREWVEGKAWVFDDTIEHEAWNPTASTRVILLFEIWRPDLTAEERALVDTMFAAIDAHSGQKPAWEI
jgi:aspartate beta-hydroxylase